MAFPSTLPPVISPPVTGQYDTLNVVMDSAKARLNDKEILTLTPVSPKILDNGQYFTQKCCNDAWRNLQDQLADMEYSGIEDEVIITGLPAVASTDPASQTWLSWAGYFDGKNFWPTPTLPTFQGYQAGGPLPLLAPLKIWERWTGFNNQFGDPPMEKMLVGLPSTLKTNNIRFWEWRKDAIFMPGSQMPEDLRIKYSAYYPDFADQITQNSFTPWFALPVPIMRCSDALSWFIAAQFVQARGDLDAAGELADRGIAALAHIINRDVRANQRVNIRRRPRSGRPFGRDSGY